MIDRIKYIKARIVQGKQLVVIAFYSTDKAFYMSPETLREKLGIEIFEIEILWGACVQLDCHHPIDKSSNSNLNRQDIYSIRGFKLEDDLDKLREKNSYRLRDFQVIQNTFTFHKFGNWSIGFDIGLEKAIFTFSSRIEALTRLSRENLKILNGAYISPEYFQSGDKLIGGDICRKSDVLLKDLNLRYSKSTMNAVAAASRNRELIHASYSCPNNHGIL